MFNTKKKEESGEKEANDRKNGGKDDDTISGDPKTTDNFLSSSIS